MNSGPKWTTNLGEYPNITLQHMFLNFHPVWKILETDNVNAKKIFFINVTSQRKCK